MKRVNVGDIVTVVDGSYAFGVENGKFSGCISNLTRARNNLTVVLVGLKVMRDPSGVVSSVCDTLVTNGKGGYWFVRSDLCRVESSDHHTIIIDGKAIELSQQSFDNLKEQLT